MDICIFSGFASEGVLAQYSDKTTQSGRVCLCVCSSLFAGQVLERIATEFNQLQFHAVQSKGMPLLDKVRPVSLLQDVSL